MVKTVDVIVQWEGKDEVIVVKKLTWGERNKVIEETIGKVKVLGGETPQMEIDQTKWRNSVVTAPFPITIDGLNALDTDVADPIFKVVMELNPFRDLF
jgi:delta 1-pyrroline-5-carboxylate dehydrogenase